ncbi:MAG: penicillin acylase family protein [Saprospiraceae bacterium]|nr:penicillin acylase family protein [Saprospiraceae bacterium]
MRNPKQLILPLIAITVYTALLHVSIPTSSGFLPPLGNFLNPFSGFWQNAEATTVDGKYLSGLPLTAPVDVVFDDRLVPHVFARSRADLAFAQGYLHAYHRLWQMDISARQAAGRLAEVFGERLLDLDLNMRRMGVPNAAKQYAISWQACESYPILESYVAGVNHYISSLQSKDYPLEFKLFNYSPEQWSPTHAALIMMSMNITLCSRNEDLAASATLDLLGRTDFDFLFPMHNPRQSPVIPPEVEYDFNAEIVTPTVEDDLIGSLPYQFQNLTERHVGSNNWALSGDRTASSTPILCNDPHLNLTLPSIWYEMQLASDKQNTYGVTLPGVPNILIGFNKQIAWGLTNVGMDVSDLIKIQWLDETNGIYALQNEAKTVRQQIDTIFVKGSAPVIDTVRYTNLGPLYIDDSISLALRWLPLTNATEDCVMETFAKLNMAVNLQDYGDALAHFQNPPQNFAFAAKSGDIALRIQGRIPARSDSEARFVSEASEGSSKGAFRFIPAEKNPMVINPERGFVSSANQRSTDTTYPYAYHGYFDHYRGRTLNKFLLDVEDADVEDMKALQLSTFSLLANELSPLLLSHLDELAVREEIWYQRLVDWDHQYRPESIAPIFFNQWRKTLVDLVWDEIPRDDRKEFLRPATWRLIELLEDDPTNKFFDRIDTDPTEDVSELVQLSFAQTKTICDSLFREDSTLTWASYKQVYIKHLSRIPAFSSDALQVGGTASALNSIKETHGPSWRMIIQLGDKPEAWGIYPGGQSGNPGSPYYRNTIDDWVQGNYYSLHIADSPSELESHRLFHLNLAP